MAIRNTNLGGTDWQDNNSSPLDGSINDSVTTITVDDTTGFKSSGIIKIDSELITYTGTNATQFTGCTRGTYNTTAASHTDNTVVYEKEVILSADLNDTMDAAVEEFRNNPAFWLNTNTYDVFEDFNSISTTAHWGGNSTWTTTTSGTPDATEYYDIVNSQIAGGTTNEFKLGVGSDGGAGDDYTVTLSTSSIEPNRHIFARVACKSNGGSNNISASFQVSINGSSFYTVHTLQDRTTATTSYTNILIVAKGSDEYDVYGGGKLLASGVSDSTPNLAFRVARGDSGVGLLAYIDDVRQSKYDV